ncbi:Hypothetical predicted protein [Mytilus galloprovincialis]|uniref:Integrase catalytic domain-containing protein n=1 Tax=Mytilus galloprovincialis TaxID=29158 RepID=A0A8B6H1E8_MYTGA|nr:Hypothetical predicted protein [Mytilus galloprovincialis]
MNQDTKTLSKVYYSESKPAAYQGAQKIKLVLKGDGNDKIGIHKIRKWLQNQDDYSLQKPVRRRFQRARVVVSEPKEQLDIDLADMQSLNKDNDGIRFLLVAVDLFSRFAWVVPLKDKTGKEVEKALAIILDEVSPKKIRSDAGTEFKNKWITKLLKHKNIYHHITLNEVKANYVERLNKTLKSMIYRYLAKHKSKRYIDALQDLVKSYNATPHRSLNNIAPRDVNTKNAANLWAYMYLRHDKGRKRHHIKSIKKRKKAIQRTLYKYKKNQLVRIAHQRRPFQRVYNEQWSYEVFKIYMRFQIQGFSMFKLVDLQEKNILGMFYTSELQPVNKSEDALWEIEKIIKKRKRNKKVQFLVKWLGYSERFNSWVSGSDVKNL